MKKLLLLVVLPLFLLGGLPLLGILMAGKDVSQYCEFPPLTRYVSHASFSWYPFWGLVVIAVLVFALLLLQLRQKKCSARTGLKRDRAAFPWWGFLGLFILLVSWIAAWNRFSLLQPVQAHTFFPLWIGYILFVNGLACLRSGSCLLVDQPVYFVALFPVSACFWWFFEYLNRFAQNWHYVGIDDFGVLEYVFHASLSFSTVLPAVLSTEGLLASFPKLAEPLQSSFPLCFRRPKYIGAGILGLSVFGLLGIGIWPDYLFPVLWLSPLFILVTIQKMTGQTSLFDGLCFGDWRSVWLPALAALVCGFFWELWNVKSYAHWEYSIPFVQKGHIFEMPILGYLGYLPFGLECRAVASLVEKVLRKDAQ